MILLEYNKFESLLREKLDDYRYEHSICVAREAERLAEKYGCDKERAYLAGLLHDITKNISREEHLKIFQSSDIILTDVEKSSEKLWHAISGACYAQHELGIDDKEMISAIRYHTTAKSDMSLLEKIIYVADFTSADRNYPDVDVMRQLSDRSLEDAMKYALKYTVNDLMGKNKLVHPDTVAAYNFILNS